MSRSSRIFVSALAVLMALLVSTPKDPEAATHQSRTIRSGGQRLDSTDAVDHSFEDPHLEVDLTSDEIQIIAPHQGSTPVVAVLPNEVPSLAPPSSITLLHGPPGRQVPKSLPHRPYLGRAPPSHS